MSNVHVKTRHHPFHSAYKWAQFAAVGYLFQGAAASGDAFRRNGPFDRLPHAWQTPNADKNLAPMLPRGAGRHLMQTNGVPYTIVGQASQRCVDTYGRSNAQSVIATCNPLNANRIWTPTAAHEIRLDGDPATCLAVLGNSVTEHASVGTQSCNGSAYQQWQIGTASAGFSALTPANQAGLCLDVKAASTADQAPLQLYPCHGASNERFAFTALPADTQAPTPPSGLALSNTSCQGANLTWKAATDNVVVLAYDIFHDGQLIKSVPGTTLSSAIPLVAGAPWELYVQARDAAGNVSQASANLAITPPACTSDTTPPTQPQSLAGSVQGVSASLTWTASTDNVGVTAYDIFRNGTQVGASAGSGTTPPAAQFLDNGLSPSATYIYDVIARDAQGNQSPPSASLTLRTGNACVTTVCSVQQVGADTDIPWGLVTLADGTILYNERDAHKLVHLDPSTGKNATLGVVPNVSGTDGEGGLLGLTLSPTFATDRLAYFMYTTATDNRISHFQLKPDLTLDTTSEKVLVSGILRNEFHNGGRLRIGPDSKLYATTGDAQNGANAQNIQGLNGKILRINLDGSVPTDNPFGNYVWSYGHRNPQGLAFDAAGNLWEQEFGNSALDETNLITKGGNYGWPNCEGTISQSGSGCSTPGYIAPKQTYPVAEGSCSGIAVVGSQLFVACERGERMYGYNITGTSLAGRTEYFAGTYGRLRTVEPAPGNGLWLTTTNLGDKDSIADNSNEKILRVQLGA